MNTIREELAARHTLDDPENCPCGPFLFGEVWIHSDELVPLNMAVALPLGE